jgi:probable F420-dependent oxidoreductase
VQIEVALTTAEPSTSGARAVELAALGVDGVFTFENAHDVFFPLVLAAGHAQLDLATNVAIAFPRSPLHVAYAANDLQLLSGGRFRLGLGTQIRPHIERRYGATWSRPVARMAEFVRAVKAIQAAWQDRTRLEFRGEFTTHTLMTPNFDPGPNPFGPPPVLVGALGPRMTAMAAEVADGLLLMPFNSGRHLRERTLPAIAQGLAAADRRPEQFEVVAEVICAVGRNDAEIEQAARAVRSLLAFYGSTPSYRPVLEVHGWGDLQPVLNDLSKRGQWVEMAGTITDEMVETLCAVGTPSRCAAAIAERVEGVADRVCCYFPGYPIADATIAELASALHQR